MTADMVIRRARSFVMVYDAQQNEPFAERYDPELARPLLLSVVRHHVAEYNMKGRGAWPARNFGNGRGAVGRETEPWVRSTPAPSIETAVKIRTELLVTSIRYPAVQAADRA